MVLGLLALPIIVKCTLSWNFLNINPVASLGLAKMHYNVSIAKWNCFGKYEDILRNRVWNVFWDSRNVEYA